MKLHELLTEIRDIPVPKGKSAADIPDDITNKLRGSGWKWEGSGSFSNVFSKGNDVVKIFLDDESPGTRCLIRFHRIAMKVNNPHLPKVYFVKTYAGEPHERIYPPQKVRQHFIIGTERLYPINTTTDKKLWNTLPSNPKERASRLAFLMSGIGVLDMHDVINELEGMGAITYPPDTKLWQKISVGMRKMRDMSLEYIKKHPEDPIIQAIRLVNDMPEQDESCFNDMGGLNTMMRKDGTIVLSDPIADDEYYGVSG